MVLRKQNRRSWIVFLALSVFGAIVLAMTGLAGAEEEGESFDDYILEDTVVTATKTGETNLQETPISITALSDEQLKTRSTFNLVDLAAFSPNTDVWSSGGRQTYYIRGIGNASTSFLQEPNVGIYLDGVYMERGLGAMNDFVDVERVEVLRGPQGTLYGRNSTGGAINILTKLPSDELSVKLVGEYARFDKLRLDASIAGPIAADKLLFRITGSTSQWDGHYDIIDGPTDQDNSLNAIRATLDFKPSDNLEFLLRGDYQKEKNETPTIKLINDTGFMGTVFGYVVPDDFYEMRRNVQDERESENSGVSGTITWSLPIGATLRSITAYRKYDEEIYKDGDGSNIPWQVSDIKSGFETFSQELQLDGTYNSLNWIVGGFYYTLDDDGVLLDDFTGIQGIYYMLSPHSETDAYAFFGNLTYGLLDDRLKVGAGVRYSHEEKKHILPDFDIMVPGVGAVATIPGNDLMDSWEALTPKFLAEYKINDDAMIYANIAQGFRAGTFAATNPEGLRTIDPETNWSYEAGLKTDWMDKRLRINAAAFMSFYDDMQVDTLVISPATGLLAAAKTNAGESEIWGVELEAIARPLQALTLNLALGYLNAEYTEFKDVRNPITGIREDVSGNQMPFTPEWQMSLGAQYVFTLGEYGFLTCRGDLSWQDKVFFNEFNFESYSRDSLTLVNAFMRYETADSRWSVELYGKNLIDEEYFLIVSPGGDGLDKYGDLAMPATYGLRVSFNY
ncbi:MAG: TonB-dependent receptor [Deltaproteobacteria bacterium]|nr:TonB-dependent receptor [Deltaproteobacteria bacterium]